MPKLTIITLARKPLEGSIVKNVAIHGTGALNIDGTRVSTRDPMSFSRAAPYTEGDGGQERTWNPTSTPGMEREQHEKGRWPANFILRHLPGCKPKGAVRLEGEPRDEMTPTTHDAPTKFGYSPERHQFNYAGEAVERWECVEGCAVRDLDGRSQESHSCRSKTFHKGYGKGGAATFVKGHSHPDNQYDDAGGASRFFKQVKADE